MRFPLLFRKDRPREKSPAAQRERQDALERRVTQGLRTISELLTRMANNLESQRLARSGYEKQERFLERDKSKDEKPSP